MKEENILQHDQVDKSYSLNFFILIIGRIMSDLGSAAVKFGMSLYVLDLTGSAAAFSMILAFAILPGVFVNTFLALYVDKGNKKKYIVGCDILSGIAVMIFLAIFKIQSSSILLFIVYSVTLGAIQAVFLLALNASIPEIVSKNNVARANSAFQSVGALTNLGGPVVGAIAYSSVGMDKLFLICGIAFILSGIIEIFLKFKGSKENSSNQSYLEGLKEVFSFLKNQKGIRFMLIIIVIINLIFTPLISLVLPFINYNQLNVSGLQLSIIQGAWTVGMIIAAIYVSAQKSVNGIFRNIFRIFQIEALTILTWIFPILSIFNNISTLNITIIFSIVLIIGGTLNAIINITALTFLQLKVPSEIRARIFGIATTASLIAVPLGMAVYGILLDNIKWPYITIFSAIILAIVGLLGNLNSEFKKLSCD